MTDKTATADKIPVTVLTGYLGAGKTTLLNRILSEQHGKKYAVIVNEFGEIGIDNDLVVGADEEVFEMNNGCICCTVRGDLMRILGDLMRREGQLRRHHRRDHGACRSGAGGADLLCRRECRAADQARRGRHCRRRQVAQRQAQGRSGSQEPDRLRRRDPDQQDRSGLARRTQRSRSAHPRHQSLRQAAQDPAGQIPLHEISGTQCLRSRSHSGYRTGLPRRRGSGP